MALARNAELLEELLCIETWGNELCVLTQHFAEYLLPALVNRYDAAEVNDSREPRILLKGRVPGVVEFAGEVSGYATLNDPALLGRAFFDGDFEHTNAGGHMTEWIQPSLWHAAAIAEPEGKIPKPRSD
jgi:hypothetical protein